MLQITKGAANTIIVTATEKQTLASPYYLFRFISEGGMNIERTLLFTPAQDTSPYPDRYNQFSFIESIDLTFPTGGIWEYRIYEQTSASNTNYNNATSELEIGLAYVHATDNVTFAQGESTDTIVWTS